jgi:hypothetical protein
MSHTEEQAAGTASTEPDVIDAEAEAKKDAPKQKAKKEKEPKEPRAQLEEAHGVTRPADPLSKTGQVWAMADKLSAQAKRPIERKAVMDALKDTINVATIATQYGKWRHFNGLKGVKIEVPAPPKKEEPTEGQTPPPAAEQNTAS